MTDLKRQQQVIQEEDKGTEVAQYDEGECFTEWRGRQGSHRTAVFINENRLIF